MVEWAVKYQSAGSVAAFIAEPVMGEGGIIVPPANYFRKVKEVLDRYGILFIADEVQSGFGRTGKLFAVEHFGVEPDILVMAKGIADGFPLSATIARAEIADSFQPGEHLSTFGGNPVCCAAALANIDVMLDEDLPGQAAAKGNQVMAQLQRDGERARADRRRARAGPDDRRRAGHRPEPARLRPNSRRARSVRSAVKSGVLIGVGGQEGNVLRIQPPLTISEAELERTLEVIGQGLAQQG